MLNSISLKTTITGLKDDELMEKEKKELQAGGKGQKNTTRIFNINNEEDNEAIKTALNKYVRVEDKHVDLLPPCCYLRYICKETGELKYAGKLIKHYETNGEKYILFTRYYKFFTRVHKRNRIFFVRDDEEGKLEQEEKTYIYRLFKSGKLKLMNDEDNPTMEPTEYFDEYFFIKD